MFELNTRKDLISFGSSLIRYKSNLFEHEFSVDFLYNELGISLHMELVNSRFRTEISPTTRASYSTSLLELRKLDFESLRDIYAIRIIQQRP